MKVQEKGEAMNYVSTWKLPLFVLLIFSYFGGTPSSTAFIGAVFLLVLIKSEWDNKFWLANYRKKERERLEQKIENSEEVNMNG